MQVKFGTRMMAEYFLPIVFVYLLYLFIIESLSLLLREVTRCRESDKAGKRIQSQ